MIEKTAKFFVYEDAFCDVLAIENNKQKNRAGVFIRSVPATSNCGHSFCSYCGYLIRLSFYDWMLHCLPPHKVSHRRLLPYSFSTGPDELSLLH
jgi:hypothetical protein